jgi:hypothetical protein
MTSQISPFYRTVNMINETRFGSREIIRSHTRSLGKRTRIKPFFQPTIIELVFSKERNAGSNPLDK